MKDQDQHGLPEPAAADAPKLPPLAAILLALTVGIAGGALFRWLTMPLPWMLGAMTFNMVAALLRLPIRPPIAVRPYVVIVIGVMLGSGFSSEIVGRAADWSLSVAFLAVYLAISAAVVVPYYRIVGGFDARTAYFAGMPGGLNEMILIGRDMGADDRAVTLAHAARVFTVVCAIALWFRLVQGYALADRSQFGVPLAEIPMQELAVLAACGAVGALLGPLIRLPAPMLVGPMLVSALVHVIGVSDSPPPSELVVVAQIFLGTILGCRFVGSQPRTLGRMLLLSLGATTIALGISLGFALLFSDLFGQSAEQVLLAFAPGGLAEMSLVALAMNAEVAYVASHHTIRIALVIILAPLVFRLIDRR